MFKQTNKKQTLEKNAVLNIVQQARNKCYYLICFKCFYTCEYNNIMFYNFNNTRVCAQKT